MSLIVILLATGMFAYWFARGWLVAFGGEETIVTTLQKDSWTFKRMRIAMRVLLFTGSSGAAARRTARRAPKKAR